MLILEKCTCMACRRAREQEADTSHCRQTWEACLTRCSRMRSGSLWSLEDLISKFKAWPLVHHVRRRILGGLSLHGSSTDWYSDGQHLSALFTWTSTRILKAVCVPWPKRRHRPQFILLEGRKLSGHCFKSTWWRMSWTTGLGAFLARPVIFVAPISLLSC